jgi:hypothetical protein
LPRPFFDRRTIMDNERLAIEASLPLLRRARAGSLAPGEWADLYRRMLNFLANVGRPAPPPGGPTRQVLMAMADYPRAKEALIAAGMPKDRVEAMAADEAIARYHVAAFDQASDRLFAAALLPYPQAIPALMRAEEAAIAQQERHPAMFLLPLMSRAVATLGAVDRRIAMLQTIEAIRAYAAGHDGNPPATLGDLTDLPAPLDPLTGRSFEYSASGRSFSLQSPPDGSSARVGRRYDITLAH